MFLTVVLLLFFALVLYLLFMPMQLFIDTSTQQYYAEIKGLTKVSIEPHKEDVLRIKLRVIFFTFYVYPFKSKPIKKKGVVVKEKAKKKPNKVAFRKVLKLLQTFTIKQFRLQLDTGDCILNAKLYPVVAFLNFYTKGNANINFQNINALTLEIENRPYDIIKLFINH
ncbi:hypothetical protein [Polaribacter sp. SA4-12]|uniref:hypothetical protein n=1 Tax=Polaribacter sp. SA4-12 TaxID=1312072 RepID=UPI0012FA0CF6|nr:hypothetical protein [Polaribacter sp. SA4-12]